MTKHYDPHTGRRIHAPKPIAKTSETATKRSITNRDDCYNLYGGIDWVSNPSTVPLGNCFHYDDSAYEQALADWEEAEADFQERFAAGEIA